MERDRETEELMEILVVEDSLVQAERLRHLLEENGFHAVAANNGLRAVEMLTQGCHPFLIISDIMMPEMDGYDFCKWVRKNEPFREIPVILLTSLSDIRDVIKGLECGASNFIVKPYNDGNLISRIHQCRKNIELRQDATSEECIHVYFAGSTYHVSSDKLQIMDFLLSTYEEVYLTNKALIKTEHELQLLNEDLEKKVAERTMHLDAEIVQRKKIETELKQKTEEIRDMSQQLWQTAKLATVGELTASIAHELNNPLTTISLRVEAMISGASANDDNKRHLDIVWKEIKRMADLVGNLLQFSRRTAQQISTLSVCEEIDRTLELIYYHLRKYNVAVVREFAPDVPQIHADRQQLRQLFLNLFTNASDAMPKGGTLTIRVSALPESGRILIEIADTGEGIPAEILTKVMEPFYTTKPEGKGTGLGLAICRRIVEEHNGTFEIVSEGIPGKGTTARICLPVGTDGRRPALM